MGQFLEMYIVSAIHADWYTEKSGTPNVKDSCHDSA